MAYFRFANYFCMKSCIHNCNEQRNEQIPLHIPRSQTLLHSYMVRLRWQWCSKDYCFCSCIYHQLWPGCCTADKCGQPIEMESQWEYAYVGGHNRYENSKWNSHSKESDNNLSHCRIVFRHFVGFPIPFQKHFFTRHFLLCRNIIENSLIEKIMFTIGAARFPYIIQIKFKFFQTILKST